MTSWNNSSLLFNISHTKWGNHYKVNSADGTPILFADNSSFTPGKPDLTFHSGADDTGRVVSVCKFKSFSRTIRVGLGDPANPNDITWEEISCLSRLRSKKYRMETSIPDGRGGFYRRSFIWNCPSFTSDQDLVDEKSGEPVAHFDNTSFSFSKDGKLYLNRSYDQAFELMVITSTIGLIEKQRRARNASAAAAGSSGGG